MILDTQGLFSDDQAITASAASSNVIDLGAPGTVLKAPYPLNRDIGKGNPIPLLILVTTAFATLTSLKVAVQTASEEAFTVPQIILESEAIPLAQLIVGYRFPIAYIPEPGVALRYLRLFYTVAGSNATAGKVTAGITGGNQSGSVGGGLVAA